MKTLAQSSIDKTEYLKLEQGELIIHQIKVKDNSWPRLNINLIIDSSPIEALAIFLALDHQKNYLPGLLKSTPVKHISPTEVLTEYELELPWPLANSHYTHGSNFKRVSENKYQSSWYMTKSDSAHSVTGEVYFTEYKNKTLMQYTTLIRPKSALSGIVRGFMIKDTRASMEAIRTETQRAKKNDKELLKKYVSYIQRALQGENVYKID
jgi:hypothetical protein